MAHLNVNLQDSAILTNNANSRAVLNIGTGSMLRGFKRTDQGILYGAFIRTGKAESGKDHQACGIIMTSIDNGFTWTRVSSFDVDRDFANTVIPGHSISLEDHIDNGLYTIGAEQGSTGKYSLTIKEIGSGDVYDYWNVSTFDDWNNFDETFQDAYCLLRGDVNTRAYLWFIDDRTNPTQPHYPRLLELDFNVDSGTIPGASIIGSLAPVGDARTFKSKFDVVSTEGVHHFVGATDDTPEVLTYAKLDVLSSGFFTSEDVNYITLNSPIASGTSFNDIGIDVDGFDNLCVVYGDNEEADPKNCTFEYALSTNGGDDWVFTAPDLPTGATTYIDEPQNDTPYVRSSVLGTQDAGFILSATYNDASGIAGVYAKRLQTTTGVSGTYVESDWERINTRDDQVATSCNFFREFDENKSFAGFLNDVRFSYMVGEGDDLEGEDKLKTAVWQERITNSAFPNEVPTVSAFDENVDFFASGFIGANTSGYLEAFEDLGTSVTIRNCDPIKESNVLGQSGFELPTVQVTEVFVDEITYDRLPRNVEDEIFVEDVDRDIRRLYFRPDFFMSRVTLFSDTGRIRRTIWDLVWDGKLYEITQVRPKLLAGEILYYVANLYVIGPSNNPWTKLILPSES